MLRSRVGVFSSIVAVTFYLLAVCGSPLSAAPDNEVNPTQDAQTEPAAKSESDSTPAPVDEKVDNEKVKPAPVELLHESDDEADVLERAIAGMRSAQQRISSADTSGETQKIQEQVVSDLQAVLAKLKKQRNRQQSQSQNQNRDQNQQQQSERQKMQKEQTDPQNSSSKKKDKSSESRDGRRNDGKSADSQERADPARAVEEKARRAQMVKDVWGHLPPHVREAMLNSVSEKYLPKYEELVKKYYEALAQKQTTDNRKNTGK